jgi:hypothetical protein
MSSIPTKSLSATFQSNGYSCQVSIGGKSLSKHEQRAISLFVLPQLEQRITVNKIKKACLFIFIYLLNGYIYYQF